MTGDDSTLVEPLEHQLARAGFARDENSVALLRRHLVGGDSRARVLALRGLARRALLRVDEWVSALSDEDVDVRREVTQLLAYEALPAEVADALRARLADHDALVVEAAAFALGEHEDAASVPALCAIAERHEDARCREAAVAALGAIGDEASLPTVIGALEDKAPIRRRAIVALSNFEGPEVDDALERAGDDRDWQVRAAVTQLRPDES